PAEGKKYFFLGLLHFTHTLYLFVVLPTLYTSITYAVSQRMDRVLTSRRRKGCAEAIVISNSVTCAMDGAMVVDRKITAPKLRSFQWLTATLKFKSRTQCQCADAMISPPSVSCVLPNSRLYVKDSPNVMGAGVGAPPLTCNGKDSTFPDGSTLETQVGVASAPIACVSNK
ncbi:hypothetical protein PRIPAC_78571, partial [Pristionchus pacificus]|uniref:Uncharacterized protein n=1 Tax=Pristionchus pacificus TaxID=54126 RepID=A0A2A6CL19_PRIPA